MLGRPIADLDLAYQGPARALAEAIAREAGGTLVALDEETRVYRIVLRDGVFAPLRQIDVAEVQGKDIHEDLLRRDFTVNAMAAPIAGGVLIDPRGGLKDVRSRTLRADDPKVFIEDPLRLLRAFRIAAQLDLTIEPATLKHIRAHRKRVGAPAGERVRQELMALLSVSPCHVWLRRMDETGLLTALFPDLEASRRCATVYYGEGGVLRHTLDCVERMDTILQNPNFAFPGLAEELLRHYSAEGGIASKHALLRLAILLHDVAKPATAKRIGGRLRFFLHDSVGARMATEILKTLRCSRDEIDTVALCIRHHLRPGNLAANATVSNKAVHRFFKDLGPRGVSLLLVCWADHASYLTPAKLRAIVPDASANPNTYKPRSTQRHPDTLKTLKHLQVLNFLLRNYLHLRETVVAPPRLLNGNVVMRALRIKPGPAVGRILDKLQEAQAAGEVKDKDAALAFIRKLKRK
ncbi:MAG: HD domain-containing protein [Elusimicrobia bacterium]|nr:HD domain-containing protein [Elusimicrobiota bacterium]